MKLHRPRLTLRRMMVLIALVAVGFQIAVRLLRPYPTIGILNGDYNVLWSDGSSTSYWSWNDHPSLQHRDFGPFVWMNWKDGSSSLHWRYTPKRPRSMLRLDPPLRIPEVQHVTF